MIFNSAQANNTSFTGIIPVRVFIDGAEKSSEKEIKAATRQLTTLLTGPLRDNEKSLNIARKFALRDSSYNFTQAISGLKLTERWKKAQPSDFFRLIKDGLNRFFLFTGYQGEQLARLGKAVGQASADARFNNTPENLDLIVAKRNYQGYLRTCLEKLNLRITEGYNQVTRERTGAPVELHIHMDSNKKYGKSTFKMKLADISFIPQ